MGIPRLKNDFPFNRLLLTGFRSIAGGRPSGWTTRQIGEECEFGLEEFRASRDRLGAVLVLRLGELWRGPSESAALAGHSIIIYDIRRIVSMPEIC